MALQLKNNDANKPYSEEQEEFSADSSWSNMPVQNRNAATYIPTEAELADYRSNKKHGNAVTDTIKKLVVALVVVAIIVFGGKYIKGILMPDGIDLASVVMKSSEAMQAELGEKFTDNPSWAKRVYEYAEGDLTCEGSEDIGILYLNGRHIGIHIPTKKYTIFNIRVNDGETSVYNNTTYPFENFSTVIDTMEGNSTLYIYYNKQRNDCIFIVLNNTTNRVQGMTYYYDMKTIMAELDSF